MPFLCNYDQSQLPPVNVDYCPNAQIRGFSGYVQFDSAARQLYLAILVPASAPPLKVTIPWITNIPAGFVPGLPKLYIDPGCVLGDETGAGHVDGPESGLIEVAPTDVDTTTVVGRHICTYQLSLATVRPYAGVGTSPSTGGLVLRSNIHKNLGAGDINTFPVYTAADWIDLPVDNNIGLIGVTVGNDTGPMTVETLGGVINGRLRSRAVHFSG